MLRKNKKQLLLQTKLSKGVVVVVTGINVAVFLTRRDLGALSVCFALSLHN